MFTIKREKQKSEKEYELLVEAAVDHTDGPLGASVKCDWFKSKNSRDHHTDEYENRTLILRRGQTFELELVFEGVESSEVKKTFLIFTIDINSESVKSIQTLCPIVDSIDKTKMCMKIIESSSTRLLLKVNIPANVIIGRYSVDVHIPSSSDSLKHSSLIILFNPWSEDDEVYLAGDNEKNEYVLNETGTMYQGSSRDGEWGIYSKKWNFGQFEKDILDCVLSLLDKDKVSEFNPLKALAKQSSPLYVSRLLSAWVNSNDDRGVLIGNWSGNYEGGTAPSSWNGSVQIIQDYHLTQQPVRYGQCWVFAGVLNTALRTLGIPARTISNFDSAHDTDQTMTIDYFYDEEGNPNEFLSRDSVWNFHVWNEMWCVRKDLPDGKYDGWQVVDATPQEHSFGIYRLGPSPVKAVKEGEIYAGVDTGFVFGEVNADYVVWTVVKDDENLIIGHQPTYKNSRYIGSYISTKKVGIDDREDVTRQYKYPEGSAEERKAFNTAFSFGAGALRWTGHFNFEAEGKDVRIDINSQPSGIIENGKNITGIIDVTNTSGQLLKMNVTVVINSVSYTGEVRHLITRKKFENVSLGSREAKHFEVPIEALEYIKKLVDLNMMKMVVVVKVLDTNKMYVDTFNFQLRNKDRVEVQVDRELRVGQPSEVKVKFHNNLPIPLHNLVVTIEGAGLTRPQTQEHAQLASDETLNKTFSITPYKKGTDRTLIVDVDCDEVKDFKGYVDVIVRE